jgi:hypothetical protein
MKIAKCDTGCLMILVDHMYGRGAFRITAAEMA